MFFFGIRYEKKYETVEEMKLRFEIFKENRKLIKSTNRKGLPYTLAVNGKVLFCFLVLIKRISVFDLIFIKSTLQLRSSFLKIFTLAKLML